jgi:hypothetical protein
MDRWLPFIHDGTASEIFPLLKVRGAMKIRCNSVLISALLLSLARSAVVYSGEFEMGLDLEKTLF